MLGGLFNTKAYRKSERDAMDRALHWLDFMGLRGVKFFWRSLLIGWLLLVSALIAVAYWIALK